MVAMPAKMLIDLLSDPRSAYANYETLVGAGLRTPASPESDELRRAIGGAIFGSYADKIRYGCLSLTGHGLSSYGGYACCIADDMIMTRVSFLEENSYKIAPDATLFDLRGRMMGHRAVWDNRADLCTAKLAKEISPSQGQADWQSLLVFCDGNRDSDKFVEAHIYGPFTADSIDSILRLDQGPLSAFDKIVAELWNSRRGGAA